jgi:dTDP-4-amino-4,6-dideoxygalactose transaminase
MTVFSFHPVKQITTGEGGAVLTNRADYYDKLRLFRSHGITKDPSKLDRRDPTLHND